MASSMVEGNRAAEERLLPHGPILCALSETGSSIYPFAPSWRPLPLLQAHMPCSACGEPRACTGIRSHPLHAAPSDFNSCASETHSPFGLSLWLSRRIVDNFVDRLWILRSMV